MRRKDRPILEAINTETMSAKSFNSTWMPLLTILTLAIAVVSIVLTRNALEGQAALADEQAVLRSELAKTLLPQQSIPNVEAKPKDINRVAALRLVREAIDISGELLQAEMEQVASDLQNQFPKLPDALHVVAMMKAQTRQYSDAQKLWEECVRLAPKQEIYCVNLASIAMEMGDNERAIRALDEGAAAGFDSFDFLHHMAIALSKLGRYEEAVTTLQKSIKKFPSDSSNWILLGQAQLEQRKSVEAEASFRRAMEMGAASPSVFVGLGNACARQGNRDEAAKHLKTYSELMNKDKLSGQERYQVLSDKEIRRTASTVLTEAATFYFRQKDILQTERLLMRCVALAPKDLSGLRALGDLYFKSRMLAEERVVRERVLELGSNGFQDCLDLAKVCAQLQDTKSAEASLKLAMTLNPTAIEPYATLAQFHLQSGGLDQARWFAQQAIEREPTAEGFRFLASICQMQKDEHGAVQALKFARQLEKVE